MPDINTPKHKLGIAMQQLLQAGKKPCFRIDELRITMASEHSANPGHLYIKDSNWDYVGKISPAGIMQIMHQSRITAAQKLIVAEAIIDPEETAMSYGKVTGTCCCCGRTLTNKLSIELGIGPICRGGWFPEPELKDNLNLDLGGLDLGGLSDEIAITPASEPVMKIADVYRSLNNTQRMICLSMLEDIEGRE